MLMVVHVPPAWLDVIDIVTIPSAKRIPTVMFTNEVVFRLDMAVVSVTLTAGLSSKKDAMFGEMKSAIIPITIIILLARVPVFMVT